MYSDFSTKNRQRAQQLSKKLQNQSKQHQKHENPAGRLLDDRYLLVADKMRSYHTKNERFFRMYQQQLQRCEQDSKILNKNLDKSSSIEKQLFENIQKQIAHQYANYSDSLKQIKKQMNQNIQVKFRALKNDAIEDISSDFDNLCKYNHHEITKKIDKLVDSLEDERVKKEQAAQYLIYTFGDQIIKLQNLFTKQKQQRVTNTKLLFEKIDQIQDNFEASLNQQARNRQVMEQSLEKKLEEVCYQIQIRVLGKN